MVPVIRIDTLHSLTEQMGKLMQRQLGIEFSQVKMNLALIGKTITLACLGLKMTYLSSLTLVFLSSFQNTAVLTVVSMHRNTHRLQMIYQSTTGFTVLKGETAGSNIRLALATLLLLTELRILGGCLLHNTTLTGIRGKNTLFVSTIVILINNRHHITENNTILVQMGREIIH